MLSNTWNNIIDWFRDRSERVKLVRSFNDSARNSFISGILLVLGGLAMLGGINMGHLSSGGVALIIIGLFLIGIVYGIESGVNYNMPEQPEIIVFYQYLGHYTDK